MEELPYWEMINRYLERVEPEKLQDVMHCLCSTLLYSRAFEYMRIRGKYWQWDTASQHPEGNGRGEPAPNT